MNCDATSAMETERVSCVGASTTIPASNIIAANSIGSAGVSSCVRVAVRLRPLSAKELLDGGGAPVVDAQPSQNAVIVRAADPLQPHASGHPAAARIFLFDDVYAPSDSQEAVYTRSVKPLVDCFLSGFNATTLAYGQTGSGKTWTMGTGLEASSLPQELQGIVPRAIADIFSSLALKKQQPTFSFSVHVSFLELYNEDFIDLLNPRPRSAASSSSAASFAPTIREDAHGNIIWTNVREEPVSSPKELLSCLQRGSLCRSTGSTDMNASSSRSHAIFSIILKQNITEEFFTQNSASNIPDASRHADSPFLEPNPKQTTQKSLVSKFHFVDLAGSERLKRTNAEGDRKREGISINVGLLALGNVISALGDESRSSTTTHVPYRDSKLTRLLQDSLGGNSRTLMIACASPSESSFGETVSTLTYANRARNIKNKAIVNEEVGAGINAAAEREIRKLRTLVADLRDEIMSLRGGASLFGSGLNSRPSSVAGFNHTSESVSEAIAAHERDFQLHLQGERELAVQLEAAKTETQMARFTGDRFGFKCGRLMDRMNVLLEELNSVTTERDAAKIELAQWRSGKLRFCDSTRDNIKVSVASIDIKACEINSPSFELSAEMITNYNNTISELKFKLSETNDKLAWYNEVVTSFNSEESRREKILLNFNSLPGNIEEVPSPKMVRTLKTEGATSQEVSHQRKLWRALQDDPDVGQALSPTKSSKFAVPEPETVGKVRLFGLPKDTSNTFLPSHLINDTIDEEEEYEDIEDGNESEDAHSMYIDDVNISTVDDAGDEMDESKQLNQDKSVKSSTFSQEDRSSDIFMLIHRLQSDIAQHQALIDQQMKREQAYQAFKEAYESKLTVLQSQLNSVCHERDEAMKKMKTGAGSKEKPGTAAIKQRFDEQKRKLEAQIQEFKRKIAEKAKDNAQSRNEGLTKQLMQTIDSLKAEKFKALKELKKESTKIRDMKTSKEREIARLKKREKAATELAKKLERSNQLQRVILKRRSNEALQSHAKLKTVMAVLKKTGTPSASKRFKPAAIITPQISVKSQSGRTSRGSSLLNEDEALIRSLRLGVIISPDTEDAPMSIRSKFKKQMIEKELSTTVTFRIAELELNVMKSARERLFGEQRELLSERERCVAADAEVNGIWDTQKPQYMDDRLSVIDMEVAMLNAKIRNLEDEFRLGRAASVMRNHYSENRLDSFPELEIDMPQGDAGWENAVNLLRSLDVIEQEYVAVLFLQDVVDNKINVRSLETKIADQEKVIFDLRSSLSTMRGAALQTAMEYRKEMDNMRKIAEEKIASVSEEISQTLTRPKISSRRREGLGGLSRSRSSLFSYDEFGAATPKLQKMFDSAYGHGFVVLKPSIRVLSGEMQATDIERVLGGVEKALKQEVKSPIVPEDTIDSSFASDYDGSPVRKRASSFNFDGINESSTMRRYNLRPRSRRISGGDQNQNPNESIESIATPFASTVLQPSIDNGIDGFETMAIERGRTETRVISSPPRVVRASSMPESPVAADSNKAVIRDFININLKRRKRAKIADISTEHTIADLEKEIQQINSTSNSSETKLVPGITKSWSQRSNISSFRADSSFESEADVSVTIRRKQSRATLEGIDGSGADVFARLATSHTLASQAKVIHREKDADAIGSAGLSSSVKNMRDNQR